MFVSTSAIDCLGRFVYEMISYVSSGTFNITKPKPGSNIAVTGDCDTVGSNAQKATFCK